MKVVQRARKAGKTTAAVDWVLEDQDHRAILVMTASQRDTLLVNFRTQLRRENVIVVNPRRPNSMGELLLERGPLREYILDDADVLLSVLISTQIKAITVSGDGQ